MQTLKFYQNTITNCISDNKEMANMINNYFPTIGPFLAANINDPWVYSGHILNVFLHENVHVEIAELLKMLHGIDTNTSPAIEHLSSKIVRMP